MSITSHIHALQQSLDHAHQRYRLGQGDLASLVELDAGLSDMLKSCPSGPVRLKLQCMLGLTRSLEARISQHQRLLASNVQAGCPLIEQAVA